MSIAKIITQIIDFFYEKCVEIVPTFSRIFSRQLFRYAACGGGNMVLDWVLYFLVYNFVLKHEMLQFSFSHLNALLLILTSSFDTLLPALTLSSHIAALCIVFPITLFTGFWLNKYVTFTQSTLRGRSQLFRYIVIVCVNLVVNYIGLKFFVDLCGLYPTPSKMLVTVVTVCISYFGQKYYSFKK